MGGSSGGGGTIPFNMSQLMPFLPSVFKGPYNAQGAFQNQQMLSNKYPWITPAAGQFAGAQPGQAAGQGGSGGGTDLLGNPFPGGMPMGGQFNFPGMGGGGGGGVPNPSPPIPPQVQPGAQSNPMAGAAGATNAMQPAPLQQILSVLMAGAPSGG